MTEKYGYFASAGDGSDPRSYAQNVFAEILNRIFDDGVLNIGNKLIVTETDPQSLAVQINTGKAWVQGYWYENDVALVKVLETADLASPRIDRIVLRVDIVTNRSITIEVKKGTAAGSPVAPALTQTSSTYEIALAQVYVGAGVSHITDSNVTDERITANFQSDFLDNVMLLSGNQNVSGIKNFLSLPESDNTPTTDHQLTPKEYVDDMVADVPVYTPSNWGAF